MTARTSEVKLLGVGASFSGHRRSIVAAGCAIFLIGLGGGVGLGIGIRLRVDSQEPCAVRPTCADGVAVYQDQHDGDRKQVTIDGTSLTIVPFNNTQVWRVDTRLAPGTCAASIDFNVPGKPGPPPVNLTMTIFTLGLRQSQRCSSNQALIFTDPTGVLSPPGFPLNTWVKLQET